MDKMTNEVRKPPREFNAIEILDSNETRYHFHLNNPIHLREILPGDDSIRERTIPISDVKEMLEDFRSDAKRMRGEFHRLYEEINNLIKHIERENPPKQDEGK